MRRPHQLTFQPVDTSSRSTAVVTSAEGLQGLRRWGQPCPKPDPTGLGKRRKTGQCLCRCGWLWGCSRSQPDRDPFLQG